MQGGAFLFPLFVDPADAAAADAREALHPLPSADVADMGFDPARLAALIRGATTCGTVPSEMTALLDADALQRLPPWAQAVVHAGVFGGRTGSPGEHQSPDSVKRELVDAESGSPRKKPRLSENNLEMSGSVPDAEELAHQVDGSQEAEEVDECPPRTLFTNEERVAGSVDKYSEMLERLLEIMADRQQAEASSGSQLLAIFERSEVQALFQSLKVMEKASLIQKVEPDLIISLMSLLDKQVQHGLTIDLLGSMSSEASSSNEWQVGGMDLQLMTSLDVGLCQLIVMSTADIDRRVLSEETIDNCIQLLNNTVRRLILPCIDTSFATTVSLPGANAAHEEGKDEAQKSSAGRRAPSQQRVNLRSNKTLRKAIERVLPVVCEFMDHLAQLLQAVKLADRWVLHFSTAMVEFFLLEHSSFATSLQQSGLLVLRSVFVNYKDHRALVMEEIVNAMMKLPTAKRNLRTVKLLNSKEYIQRISTVVVALVQSCTSTAAIEALEEKAHRESSAAQVDSSADASSSLAEEMKKLSSSMLEEAREGARLFIGPLMKECFKKNDDRDNRTVLDNFVEDMLTMFVRPEWAGAEILLEVVSSSLASILSGSSSKDTRKAESQLSLTSLTLVGKICSAIKIQQNAVIRDKIADDVDAQATIEDYSRMLSLAGVIVKKEASQEDAKGENNCDMVVLKHIVIAYLRRGSRTEMTQVDSKRLLLLRFMLDSLSGGDINERSIIEAEAKHWQSLWGVTKSTVDTKSKVAPPSTELGLRLGLRLVVTRDFCAIFDKLLAHIMALLSNGIPSFRARVMKALAGIVDVDPMLMAEGGVRGAVQRCFLDERTSVRQAAVDLVGKYVMVQPALFDRYFDMLVDRLRDKGISVRKSVCRIFRAFLTQPAFQRHPDGAEPVDEHVRRRSACMRSLVERIGDTTEEQVVKNYVIDTFQEVWFGADLSSRLVSPTANGFSDEEEQRGLPPGWTTVEAKPSNEVTPTSNGKGSPPVSTTRFLSPDGKIARSVEEAWSTYRRPVVTPSSVVKTKRSKIDDSEQVATIILEVIHDMPSLAWFVTLLKRLLQDVDFDKAATASGRVPRDRSEDIQVARKRSEKLVSCLIERLLQLEEQNPLTGVTIIGLDQQVLACMKALSAFCEAHPPLLSAHLDHMTLYLKGDDLLSKAIEAKVQSLAVSILTHIFAGMERITPRIVSRVSGDLNQLILRAPPSVVSPSVKCLATIATNTRRPPVLLFKLLEMFYEFMLKYANAKSLADLPQDVQSKLQRALFSSGQIAGAIDLDKYPALATEAKKLTVGSVAQSLYDEYSKYLKIPGNVMCAAKAVQGLGFLFPLRPRLFFRAQQDGVLESLLTASSDEAKLQCLVSLNELLVAEQNRLEKGIATLKMDKSKSKEEQVRGDQEADAALIGSVMQAQLTNVLALTRAKMARIRTEAVACVGNLLTQGLVSPLPCIPTLVALESDRVVPIRDAAHGHLLALHEKFPGLLNTPSIQGIAISYSFQLTAFSGLVGSSNGIGGPPTVWGVDKDKKPLCLFGRLYSACIRGTRTQRNIFLKALVNQFTQTGSVLTSLNVSAAPAAAVAAMPTLGYLCYLAQLLAALPFEVEDEPLYIIYLINRHVSLKLSSSLDDLKEVFDGAGVFDGIPDDEDPEEADIDISEALTAAKLSKKRLIELHARGCTAFAICLLLRLKLALKDMYGLDNERCQTYRPANASNATDEPAVVSERARRAKLPMVDDLVCTDAVELHWRAFLLTLRAAREDQQQMDFDVGADVVAAAAKPAAKPAAVRRKRSAPAATTATRRQRKSAPLPARTKRPRRAHNKPKEESDEDDDNEDDDNEDDDDE